MNWLIEFLFPRRLHRLAYFLRIVTTNIIFFFIEGDSAQLSSVGFFGSTIILLVYFIFFILRPRVRDMGMNAWWCLLCLVPGVDIVFGIILLFRAPKYISGIPIGVEWKVANPT